MNTTTYRANAHLDRLIREQGRLRRWLAAQVGLSPSGMSRLIAGKRLVDQATAERISALLNTSLGVPFDVHECTDCVHEDTRTEDAA